MSSSNHAGFKISVILLLLCLLTLSLPGICTAQFEMLGLMSLMASQQPVMEGMGLPFDLPAKIYESSVPLFPNAIAVRTYVYTQEGRIIVYYYTTRTMAAKDMEAYASAGTRITADQSALLAEHYGCIREEKGTLSEWFTLDTYIVGIQVPSGSQSVDNLIRVGEEMIRSNQIRTEKLFSTPDKCFTTYMGAIERQETALILECFHSDGSTTADKSLKALKQLMPMLGLAQIVEEEYSHGDSKKPQVKFGQAEMLSKDTARLKITLDDNGSLDEPTAVGLLAFVAHVNNCTESHIWVPFKKDGGKWGIDLAALQEAGLADSRKAATKADCQNNLKQIGLALFMYMQDHNEKMPADISALEPYLKNNAVFKCPSDDGTQEIKVIKPGVKTSYIYVKGLSNMVKDPSRVIVMYEASPDFHGEGRNVLFMDAHVKWYAESSFQVLLKKQADLRKVPAKKATVKKAPTSKKKSRK